MKFSFVKLTLKSAFFVILLSIACKICLDVFFQRFEVNSEDISDDIQTLVTNAGYVFETHSVVTSDGYVLELHRLYASKKKKKSSNVVLLVHGLLQSSIGWLATDEDTLAFRLADKDYDVWLFNARGNRYSRRHVTLNADDDPRTFFDFSWHEIGVYDMPASIDYIINATSVERVHCVAHSQGSAVFMAMLAERPEYKNKILSCVHLSPGVYLARGFTPVFYIPSLAPKVFEWITNTMGIYELFPYSEESDIFIHKYCNDKSIFHGVCKTIIHIVSGITAKEYNPKYLVPIMISGTSGASMKQLCHFIQMKNSGIFRQYDHGIDKNIKYYNQEVPPEYNLANAQVPMALFYSANDWMIHEEDFNQLIRNGPKFELIHKETDFGHLDYLVGNSRKALYQRIENYLARH